MEAERPFGSTQRVNFVPLAMSPASRLHASRAIYPKRDRAGGLTGQEHYARLQSAKNEVKKVSNMPSDIHAS